MTKLSIIGCIFLILPITYYCINYLPDSDIYNTEIDHNVQIVDIKKLGKVEILNYEFNDIVTHKMIRDYLPDATVTLSINSNAIVCIDLSYITNTDVKIKNDTLYIKLPKPEISSLYINHSKSRIVDTEYAFTDSAELIDGAYIASERSISDIVDKYHIIDSVSIDSHGCQYIRKFVETISTKPVKLYF